MVASATQLHTAGEDEQSVRRSYVHSYSLGSLLRTSVQIYGRHFRVIFLTYVLPSVPFAAVQLVAQSVRVSPLYLGICLLISIVVGFFTTSAVTVTISDICLGNTPELRRSYGKLFRNRLWLKVLAAGTLSSLAIGVGMLLVIPGVIALVRLVLVSQVVVLEGQTGVAALKRSAALMKGTFWYTLGTLGVLILLVYGIMILLLGFAIGIALLSSAWGALPEQWVRAVAALLTFLPMVALVYPVIFCILILIYYDRRCRKEPYDVAQLAEDLAR